VSSVFPNSWENLDWMDAIPVIRLHFMTKERGILWM
jgi:hypothetical protein